MISAPTAEEARSLRQLGRNPHFQALIGWIARCLEATRAANDFEKDDVKLRQGQGSAQDLRTILDNHLKPAGERPARGEEDRE